jgi:hypothetical protein
MTAMTRPPPLDVLGHLTLQDACQRPIAIEARGPSVTVGFADLGSAHQAYLAFTRSGDSRRVLGVVQRELQRADLALEFNVRGITVARLSGNTQGNWLGRAMGLQGTDMGLRAVLRALLRW